ncbi:hypothetical protein R3I93_017506 [Phoxinus phoxinus]|uniref:DDE Tnp4 domain-containing protein n=1 Tax=Phoxinus phoxinus TaxID=58324 RepID=A0AAN9CIP1_9TELE
MMKTRFRAEVHHTFVPHVITACAILHNICLGVGDIMAPEDDAEDEGGACFGDSQWCSLATPADCRGVCPGGGSC